MANIKELEAQFINDTSAPVTLHLTDAQASDLSDILCSFIVRLSQEENRSVVDMWMYDEGVKFAQAVRCALIEQYIR